MTDRQYLAPTPRKGMSKARAARIFLAWQGRCGVCGLQIRDGEAYEIDHPVALNLGGSDDDDKLQPIHLKCHAIKTRDDKAAIAKRNTSVTRGYVGTKAKRPMDGSRNSRWKKKMDGSVERRNP